MIKSAKKSATVKQLCSHLYDKFKKATSDIISGRKKCSGTDPEMNLHTILCFEIYVFDFKALPVSSGS